MASLLSQHQKVAQSGGNQATTAFREINATPTYRPAAPTTTPYNTGFGPGGGPGGVGGGPVTPAPTPAVTSYSPVANQAASTWTNTGISTNPGSGVPPAATPLPQPTDTNYVQNGGGGGPDPAAEAAYAAQRQAELESALRALESQFNLSREELLADQTEAGDQYRFIMSALQRSREDALMGVQSGALQRGILRSGIYQTEEAKVNQDFAAQEAEAAAARTANQNAIQKAIAELEASHAQGLSGTSAAVVQNQLQSMRQLADNLALDDRLGLRASELGFNPALHGAPGQAVAGAVGAGAGVGVGVGAGLGGGRSLATGAAPFSSFGDALSGTAPVGQPRGSDTAEQWMLNQRANLLAGTPGGDPVSGKIFQEAGGSYGGNQFANLTGAPQVLGGQGGQTFYADPGAPSSLNPMGSGSALFGTPKVEVNSFLASLGPSVQAGLTEQDKQNIINFYGATGIPSDAAYNIAASASRIASQR